MDMVIKKKFLTLWKKYFNNAELPITFYYSDKPAGKELIQSSIGHRCIMTDLSKARTGNFISFSADSISCFGGKNILVTQLKSDLTSSIFFPAAYPENSKANDTEKHLSW